MNKKDSTERHVNLDHLIPSSSLLSYGDYHKVPKSEEAQLHKKDNLEYRDFLPDDSGLSIWDRLRKPEFQRATNDWGDDKILDLLKTLRENQVIPGIILWLNTQTGHIFVLDGAHRLSTIRAWMVDDWGNSQQAFNYGHVEEVEIEAAERIRLKIEETIGSYKVCQDEGKRFKTLVDESKNPSDYLDPATESRGKFMYNLNTSLRIPIQWVTGDYGTAEQSFLNINTGGTPLSDQEVLYLKNRRSPIARAITGIVANGTKPSLWLKYKDECDNLSKDLYKLILAQSDAELSGRVADYPLCLVKRQKNFERYLFLQNIFAVAIYGETGEQNLRHIMEDNANEEDDSLVANRTLENLQQAKQMLFHIYGNQSQSLGLYPAFYFYTNRGQYKDFLFFLLLAWVSRGSADEILLRKIRFTLARDLFEEVWMVGKEFIFQAYGRKGAGPTRLTFKYAEYLQHLVDLTLNAKEKNLTVFDVLSEFLKEMDAKVQSEFVKQFEQDQGKPFGRFTEATKLQSEFLSLFHQGTQRCNICGGRILYGLHQVDHKRKRVQGGTNSSVNAALIHPFCNNHKDRLEGLRKYFGDTDASITEQINFRLPPPKPDTEIIEQLKFTFEFL